MVVYYGTNAGVRVSIDNMPPVTTIMATEELIRGKVTAAVLEIKRNEPVGIFSSEGEAYIMEEPDGSKHQYMYYEANIPPIDYNTISEENLKARLRSRLASMRNNLKDPDVDVICIRGVPPT